MYPPSAIRLQLIDIHCVANESDAAELSLDELSVDKSSVYESSDRLKAHG